MDSSLFIAIMGIALGYVFYQVSKHSLKDYIEDLQKAKERAEHELEGAFDTIADLEHELVVKQNVINSLSEKVTRLQNIIKRSKS